MRQPCNLLSHPQKPFWHKLKRFIIGWRLRMGANRRAGQGGIRKPQVCKCGLLIQYDWMISRFPKQNGNEHHRRFIGLRMDAKYPHFLMHLRNIEHIENGASTETILTQNLAHIRGSSLVETSNGRQSQGWARANSQTVTTRTCFSITFPRFNWYFPTNFIVVGVLSHSVWSHIWKCLWWLYLLVLVFCVLRLCSGVEGCIPCHGRRSLFKGLEVIYSVFSKSWALVYSRTHKLGAQVTTEFTIFRQI